MAKTQITQMSVKEEIRQDLESEDWEELYPPEVTHISPHEPHDLCPNSLQCLPDTTIRPKHTMSVIIRAAIMGSTARRVSVKEIYAGIRKKFPHFRDADPVWKESVRHHLSLNRLFEKVPRPVTEPGAGSYWIVNLDAPPGTKRPRKSSRRRANPRTDSSQTVFMPWTPAFQPISLQLHNTVTPTRNITNADSRRSSNRFALRPEKSRKPYLSPSTCSDLTDDDELDVADTERSPQRPKGEEVAGETSQSQPIDPDETITQLRQEIFTCRQQLAYTSSFYEDQLEHAKREIAEFKEAQSVLQAKLQEEIEKRTLAEAALNKAKRIGT